MMLPTVDHVLVSAFLGLVVLAAAWDVASFRIPNAITLAVAALYPLHVFAASSAVDWQGGLAVGLAAFVVGTLCFGFGLLGGGDVKLIAAVALWAGPDHVLAFLIITALAGGLAGLILVSPARYAIAMASDRIGLTSVRDAALERKLPYGTAIAAGAIAALAPPLFTL